MRTRLRWSLTAIIALTTVAFVPVPASASATKVSVVASGFDNPRGVAFYRGGLLVAEAGHGGPTCGPPEGTCVGFTSQISSVNLASGRHRPLVSNLFSVHDPVANGALGVDGLSVEDGRVLAIIAAAPQWFDGFCTTAECQAIIDRANTEAGHLISVSAHGKWHAIASVGAFDFDYTAAHPFPPDEPDANPYGVLAVDDGAYVADAAANVLDFVDRNGRITVVHHFFKDTPQDYPVDAVPTCIAPAGGDALLLADLSGRLFRMKGNTATQVPLPLIHHVSGCAGDEQGNIYLVDMWGTSGRPTPLTGSVVKYRVDNGTASVVADQLNFPNMIAIGPQHTLYVSANSVCPADATSGLCAGGGKILRIKVTEKD